MPPDYDMTVIGGGAAGLVAARTAVAMGARTALVECHRLGGDCTWTGCIPSKALIRAARAAHEMRNGGRWGIRSGEPVVDFAMLRRKIDSIRNKIYQAADSPQVLTMRGVDVIPARARFVDPATIELDNGRKFTSRWFVIAAGSRPAVPKIEGIETTPYYTTDTIFEIENLPDRLIVVGAGPSGVELAQAFQRLGSRVTLLESAHRILLRDDAEASYLIESSLLADGVDVKYGAVIQRLEGQVAAHLEDGTRVEAGAILFTVGRQVNVSGLNLKSAGIRVTEYGIPVDAHARTAAKNIWAAGDVAGQGAYTHLAERMARVAVSNAILRTRARIEDAGATWTTFTDPELAQTGSTEDQLQKRNVKYEVLKLPLDRLDRAVADQETLGFVKLLAARRSGKVLGAVIVAPRAGEMIAEFALAVRAGLSAKQVASTVHAYPAYAYGNRSAADLFVRSRRKRTFSAAVGALRGLRGPVPPPKDPG